MLWSGRTFSVSLVYNNYKKFYRAPGPHCFSLVAGVVYIPYHIVLHNPFKGDVGMAGNSNKALSLVQF